jgi:hypothetical protein
MGEKKIDMKKYCNSKIWKYETDDYDNDGNLTYWLYCDGEFIGTCPSFQFLKDVVKVANKEKDIKNKIKKGKEYLYSI